MIELPNGQKVPDWATEETQQKLLDALTAITKGDKKTQEAITDLVESAGKSQKQDKENAKEADSDRDKQLNALREIGKNTKNNAAIEGSAFKSALKAGAKATAGFTVAVAGGALTAMGALVSNAMTLGTEFSKLQMVGVGLDTAGMSALNLATSMTALGFTSEQAMGVLSEYSSVVQSVGRKAFLEVNKTFAQLTGNGSRFGLTLNEAAEVLAEDLELRQQLGIIQDISMQKQAKLSADLFQQQMQATTLLGKSIDDIRGASKQALADNATVALRMKAVTANMNPEDAAEFTTAMQKATGDLAAAGIDQGLINSITEAAMAPVAFMGDSGAALNKALAALDGIAGSDLRGQIIDANAMLKAGNIDGFTATMNALDNNIMEVASNLSGAEFEQLQVTLLAQGQAGEALAMSLLQADIAAGNLSKAQGAAVTNLAKASATFTNASSAISGGFSTAMNQLSGALAGPMADFASAFTESTAKQKNANEEYIDSTGKVITAQADIMDEHGKVVVKAGEAIKDYEQLTEEQKDSLAKNNSLFSLFRDAMDRIRQSMAKLFGSTEDGTKSAMDFAQTLRDKIGPKITAMGENIAKWIDSIKPEDVEATIDGVIHTMEFLGKVISAVGTAIGAVMDFIMPDREVKLDENGNEMLDEAGNKIYEDITKWDLAASLTKGLAVVFAASVVKNLVGQALAGGMSKLTGMFKGGGSAVGTAASTAAGGAGGGIGGALKGIGKGIGGALKGLAKGLGSLGSPKVILGVATLAGLGFAMKETIAPGFKSFVDLDWETMAKAIVGLGALGAVAGIIGIFAPTAILGALALGAIGLALNLFPVDVLEALGPIFEKAFGGIATVIDSVFGGIGEVIGKVSEAINSFKTAGAEAEAIKLDAQASAMERLSAIPVENLLATSDAVNKLAASMSAFGDAVGDDGFMGIGADGADIDKQNEQIGVFAAFAGLDTAAIMASSEALSSMSDAYAKFAGLDAEQLVKVSEAMLKINDAASPDLMDEAKQTISAGFNTIKDKLGFGSSPSETPTPTSDAVAKNNTAPDATAATQSPEGLSKDGIAIVNKLEEIKSDQRMIFKKLGADLKSA
jgi:hypothetical protein